MKIFIFENVGTLTESYHEGGGLVIIANDLEAALKMAADEPPKYTWRNSDKNPIKLTDEEIKEVISYDLAGDNIEAKLFIFPDSGCC